MPEFLCKKMIEIILKAVYIMCKRVVEIYLSIVLLIIFSLYLQYLRYVAKQPVDYSLNKPVGDELHPTAGPSMWHVSEWNACSHACAGGKEIKIEMWRSSGRTIETQNCFVLHYCLKAHQSRKVMLNCRKLGSILQF